MNSDINNEVEETLETKVCISCHRVLPINMFGTRRYRSNKPDAHFIYTTYGECKECTAKRKLKWRIVHKDYWVEYYKMKKLNSKQDAIQK
jgi:hypothetical protein